MAVMMLHILGNGITLTAVFIYKQSVTVKLNQRANHLLQPAGKTRLAR